MAALELKIFRSYAVESHTGVVYEIRFGTELLYAGEEYNAVRHAYEMLLALKAKGYLKFDFQPFFDAKGAPAVFEDYGACCTIVSFRKL